MSQSLYALYHVHRETGERIRYPVSAFPAVSKQEAERMASTSRKVDALCLSADEWETQAHPDTHE